MQGYQLVFYTEQARMEGHQTLAQWILKTAASLGIKGATLSSAQLGVGHDGRLHAAGFIEQADMPLHITFVLSEDQVQRLFQQIEAAKVSVFYSKCPVEYGMLGAAEDAADD